MSESPSRMIWSKVSSFAKIRALLAANTSTISTEVGRGITCVNVAITRPWSLRIMIPKPASFLSWNTAPSKLILNQSMGGGSHLDWWRGERGDGTTRWACWNSKSTSLAKELSKRKSTTVSPILSLFLLSQICDTNMANKSEGWAFSIHNLNTSKKVTHSFASSLSDKKCISQTPISFGHDQRACNVDSWSSPQSWQVASVRTFLFTRLSQVGRASEIACHSSVFVLLGTFSFHRPPHMLFRWEGSSGFTIGTCSSSTRNL